MISRLLSLVAAIGTALAAVTFLGKGNWLFTYTFGAMSVSCVVAAIKGYEWY